MFERHTAYSPFSASFNDAGEIVVTYRYYGFKTKQMEVAHVAIPEFEAEKLIHELTSAVLRAKDAATAKKRSAVSELLDEEDE